jgi:hypothetical protein
MSPDLNVLGLSYIHILDFGHFGLIFLAFLWFGDGTVLTMQLRVTGAVYNISRRTEEVVDRQAVNGNDGESTVFHGNETLNSRQRFKLNERASGVKESGVDVIPLYACHPSGVKQCILVTHSAKQCIQTYSTRSRGPKGSIPTLREVAIVCMNYIYKLMSQIKSTEIRSNTHT